MSTTEQMLARLDEIAEQDRQQGKDTTILADIRQIVVWDDEGRYDEWKKLIAQERPDAR